MERKVSAATLVFAALLLTGCQSTPNISALEQKSEADQLPGGLTIWPENEVPASNIRLLVEHDGTQYFGAKTANGKGACVAVLPTTDSKTWVAGCGDMTDDREIVHVSGLGIAETVLMTDGFDIDRLSGEGWKPIHRNIVVTGSPAR